MRTSLAVKRRGMRYMGRWVRAIDEIGPALIERDATPSLQEMLDRIDQRCVAANEVYDMDFGPSHPTYLEKRVKKEIGGRVSKRGVDDVRHEDQRSRTQRCRKTCHICGPTSAAMACYGKNDMALCLPCAGRIEKQGFLADVVSAIKSGDVYMPYGRVCWGCGETHSFSWMHESNRTAICGGCAARLASIGELDDTITVLAGNAPQIEPPKKRGAA